MHNHGKVRSALLQGRTTESMLKNIMLEGVTVPVIQGLNCSSSLGRVFHK